MPEDGTSSFRSPRENRDGSLLILNVSVHAPGGELGAALAHSWPQYAAYAISFVAIGIWWVNHHAAMEMIARVDRPFLFSNIALLVCIAFLPFPTRLVAEHFRDDGVQAATIAYGLTLTAASICAVSGWLYAVNGRRLINEMVDNRTVASMTRSVIPGPPITAAATLVALWSPYTALALLVALQLFYVIGSSLFGRE